MKTQVIKLDSHDDVNSVRDRISWAKTERILLVFPTRSHNLTRILDLRLLQRHTARLGAQLAIVALSEEVRTNAKVLHIPTFKSTISARHQVWESNKTAEKTISRFVRPDLQTMRSEAFPPDARWQSLFGVRFLFFSMGVLAILVVFSLFIPSAEIQLIPATRLQTLTLTISARKEVTTVNLAGSLPARVTSMVVEHSKTIQTTGSVSIPDQKAQGRVRIRNLTTSQVSIPPGTFISNQSSPMIQFVTMTDAVVAAGVGKNVDIPVQAVEPGSIGNLPADALVAFKEVDLGTSLAVTNPSPTTGGTNRTASIQTLEDQALVKQILLAEILTECKSGLAQALSPGDTFFPDSLVVSQIVTQIYFPAEGQSSDTLSLTLRLKCEAQYTSQADVNNLAEMSLNAYLPEGFSQTDSGLAILPTGTPFTDQTGITQWDIKAKRVLKATLDPLVVVQLTLGRRPFEAIARLNKSLLLADLPSIKITPSWWPWMPIIPFRITVLIGDK
jgi:hypothetical protein